MKLYPKRLNSVEELKREKQRLRLAKEEMEGDRLLSLGNSDGEGIDWKEMIMGNLGSIARFLPISELGPATLKRLVRRIFNRKKKERAEKESAEGEKDGKDSLIKKVAVEVIGGYLKWKVNNFFPSAIPTERGSTGRR